MTAPIRVLLIMPDGRIHRLRLGPFVKSLREVPLTLATLAALVPQNSGFDFELVDESVGERPLGRRADLVGISVMTGTAQRAYEIAKHYRDRGITVILGGVHVSLMPGEAANHADSIVLGGAEKTFPQILSDFATGSLLAVYQECPSDSLELSGVPTPRLDLHRSSRYMIPNAVFATRGCRHRCDFCTAATVSKHYQRRPISDVIRDIAVMPRKFFIFNDVSLVDDIAYAKELFTALVPLRKRWAGLGTVGVAKDLELVSLMRRSGCQGLLIGFESINHSSLQEIHKGFNTATEYRNVVDVLHDASISVQGTFMFGFDQDDASVFGDTVDVISDIKVDIPRFSILTPHPGTLLFDRLFAEDRILSFDWADYDTMHVVFEPAKMSPTILYQGFKSAYRNAFMMSPILKRMRGFGLRAAINLVGNLTYRRFSRTLMQSPLYADPYNPAQDQTVRESLIEEQRKL